MTEKIARRGLHIHREYGVDPLERHHVADLMTQEVMTIPAAMPIAEVRRRFFGDAPPHRAYPVVGEGGRLLGVLDRRAIADAPEAGRCQALVPGVGPEHVLLPGVSARAAAGKMAALGVSRLAVVQDTAGMRLVGILSLRDLVLPSVATLHEETLRERLRTVGPPSRR